MDIRSRFNPDQLDPMETASIDELRAHQLERLQWTVNHAYSNVPMYKQRFDQLGLHPDDIKTLDYLAKLPFTTKSDLRDNYPYGMFATPMNQVVRLHASSGRLVSQRSLDTPKMISIIGPTLWLVRSVLRAGAKAICYIMLMVTACLLAAWVHIMAPNVLVVRLFQCLVGKLKSKCV